MLDAGRNLTRHVPDNLQLEHLLARTALRDRAAFQQLYELMSSHLFGVALRILHTRSLAEEALQDAFIQIWQKAGDYRADKAQVNTWMTSITRYRALDMLRKTGREQPLDDELAAVMEDPAPGPAQLSESKDLDLCMDELQDQQRECIALAYVEGYSHQELAVRMDTPLGTVKSWIRRGLQQLKECLQR